MIGGRPRLADYLGHIVEAIDRIARYTEDHDELRFNNDALVQDAVLRNIEIVGEASRNVQKHYPDIVAAHPDVPFEIAYQMRNVVAHGYFKVDLAVVWNTIQGPLPIFREQIAALIHNLPDQQSQ